MVVSIFSLNRKIISHCNGRFRILKGMKTRGWIYPLYGQTIIQVPQIAHKKNKSVELTLVCIQSKVYVIIHLPGHMP